MMAEKISYLGLILVVLAFSVDACLPKRVVRLDVIGVTTSTGSNTANSNNCGQPTITPSISGPGLNSGVSRIVNGNQAVANSWPWTVGIYLIQGSLAFYKCVGTLVSFDYVLTAASCINGLTTSQIKVSVGNYQIVGASSSSLYSVSSFIVSSTFPLYDIALIELGQSFSKTSTVDVICLPYNDNATAIIGRNVVILGWGTVDSSDATTSVSSTLSQAIVQINNNSSLCLTNDNTKSYCAYSVVSNPPNVCYFDLGSPIMFYENSKWYIYGVASSFTVNSDFSCNSSYPSYYTAVPLFLDWINTELNAV